MSNPSLQFSTTPILKAAVVHRPAAFFVPLSDSNQSLSKEAET
jgi:hypothetical protein